ncbi:uncharacterized protein TNCT_294791 [Trichonephila clavata]|uniref:Uncharacterized protein n=1 Tax=Trichonephila clavata TaxID=2740835 RepID=A0A8X6JJX6_TRICU|nr:uncharacterized protein TNCT_294791 [Trichonephila clavata]
MSMQGFVGFKILIIQGAIQRRNMLNFQCSKECFHILIDFETRCQLYPRRRKVPSDIQSQLEEERAELKKDESKVLNLLSAFYKKDSHEQNLKSTTDAMTVSFSNQSAISSLFKDDTPDSFLFKLGQGDKREHLAAERKNEYNAYLEKKDKELQSHRRVLEESRSVTPRSLLDFVDYEKLLAKRKEEESKFRNLNYAEPSFDRSISKSEISQKENINTTFEEQIKPYADISIPKKTSGPVQRTGGGGEPVKDSSGNLITNRGFKENTSLGYFPFQEDVSKHKKDFYREELRKQIEERKQLKELEKQKAQLLENQIAQRIEQQRRQMQMEYENELKKSILLKEQRQQERLQQLEEFQRRDAALRNRKTREIETPHITKEPEI